MTEKPITRRTLLTGAAAGAGAAAFTYASLPAWAKPIARAAAVRQPDSLPFPHLPAGHPTPGLEQIQHVIVLMMENHSFDNLLGMVPHQIKSRGQVDGLTARGGQITNSNPTAVLNVTGTTTSTETTTTGTTTTVTAGTPVYTPDVTGPLVTASLAASPCQGNTVAQDWNASHISWNNGANNGFVQASGNQGMWYWDKSFLPFSYSMAEHFPIGQRYFCSVMAQTYPNRRFLFCGTASGLTATNEETFSVPAANGTIFDRLLKYKVSWLNYVQPQNGSLEGTPLIVPNFADSDACTSRIVSIDQFYTDAANGKLPSFSFLDPNYTTTSEENPQDIQAGEEFLAKVVNAVMHSPQWENTALFIMYDEHGGYYDHVPPPAAIAPDSLAPNQAYANPGYTLMPGGYNRYGFRVPLFVVSPWARADYISKVVQDHTSIAVFIERKWNLPAMTFRDANAHPMTDYFDFKQPAFLRPPKLTAAPAMAPGLAECKAAGLTPPVGTPGT
jgi:phospholipase C